MLLVPIQLACTETGAPPIAGQLIGTDGCTVCSQVLICASASLGTGGLQGSLGHPPIFPAHQRNSRLGSLAFVKVPSATLGALKSKESDLILVALNSWPAEVLRLGVLGAGQGKAHSGGKAGTIDRIVRPGHGTGAAGTGNRIEAVRSSNQTRGLRRRSPHHTRLVHHVDRDCNAGRGQRSKCVLHGWFTRGPVERPTTPHHLCFCILRRPSPEYGTRSSPQMTMPARYARRNPRARHYNCGEISGIRIEALADCIDSCFPHAPQQVRVFRQIARL